MAADHGLVSRTASPGRTLPRLTLLHVGFILAPACAFAARIVQPPDFDFWWHRRTGRYIVEHLAVPHRDPFAFTTAGKTWTDHEWLSQVLMYAVESAFGYLALCVLMFALGAAACWLVYALLRREGLGSMQALALAAAPLALGATFWAARPAMFSVFFVALLVGELFAARRGERRSLWMLVPVMALWANLHGGYVIGLAVLVLFTLAGAVQPGARAPGWRHSALVLAAAFIATGVNPYTWHIWLYPFSYFGGDNASLRLVDEWQSADFHEARNAPFALLLLAGMLAGTTGARFDAFRSGLLLLFGALALQSMRHQQLFAIVWAPCVGVALAERFAWWRTDLLAPSRRGAGPRAATMLNWGLLFAGLAALASAVASSQGGLPLRDPPERTGFTYPAAGADWINLHEHDARVFNPYEWGGYLIDRFDHDNRVFIDGRADLHGGLVVEYQAIYAGDPSWRDAFARYGVDTALLPPRAPLVDDLRAAGWRTAYEDGDQVVLTSP